MPDFLSFSGGPGEACREGGKDIRPASLQLLCGSQLGYIFLSRERCLLMGTVTQTLTCNLAQEAARLRHGPDRAKAAWPVSGEPPCNLVQAQGHKRDFEPKLTFL